MGTYKSEDVLGACVENETICMDCIEESDWDEVTEDMLITRRDIEKGEKLYFCDRCKKPIN